VTDYSYQQIINRLFRHYESVMIWKAKE